MSAGQPLAKRSGNHGVNYQVFARLFRNICLEHVQPVSDVQVEKFYAYTVELLEWNKAINLTRIVDLERIIIEHFLDSLALVPFLLGATTVIDVGSGAGLPGIPLKIVLPKLRLWLVEARRKKAAFLDHVVRRLELRDTVVCPCRFEDLVQRWQGGVERVDAVTSRAVFRAYDMIAAASILVRPGGWVLVLGGRHMKAAAAQCLERGTCSSTVLVPYELPKMKRLRYILVVEKS